MNWINKRKIVVYNKFSVSEPMTIKETKFSNWKCHVFGAKDIVWLPNEGDEPNWFWRRMQYLFFGNKWVKYK